MSLHSDIVVVGGGVIGLAAAWRLAQAGARVTVLDAGNAGQSSWAAAGMLAPLAEGSQAGPAVRLGLDSLNRYPAFVDELRAETGHSLALLGPGLLRVARTEAEEAQLCASLAWQKSMGLPLHWLDSDSVRLLEPNLSQDVRAAVLSPHEKHIPRVSYFPRSWTLANGEASSIVTRK